VPTVFITAGLLVLALAVVAGRFLIPAADDQAEAAS